MNEDEIPPGYEGMRLELLAQMFCKKLAIIARLNALKAEAEGRSDMAGHKGRLADEYDQLARLIDKGIIK